ncbi:SCP2 sterol-binding domain-containing protein [Candidatus Albibeggiatoa sp. nov. BB20]|uniref:ubiquinone biosynthesis accessory factor UbiJ n=1 Tax=Candidatus Albibeggiatoa sp. nov. BB20 TaxID=3162723 RepID=UPI00336567D5
MSLSPNQLLAVAIETTINQAIRLNPAHQETLQRLQGKIVRIEVTGLFLQFNLVAENDGFIIMSEYDGQVDAVISGAPFSLLNLSLQSEPNLANHPDIKLEGDIRLVQQLTQLIKQLPIDWEEYIAQIVGDIPAHQLGNTMRQCDRYAKERIFSYEANISEYLQEELKYLPAPAEVEHFLNTIDQLRDDTERLALRVQKLQRVIA